MKYAIAITAALALSACAIIPVPSETTVYNLKSAYGIALKVAVAYRETPLCANGAHFTLLLPCHEKATVARIIVYSGKAKAALAEAERLAATSPNGLGVIDAIAAARDAVDGFKAITKQAKEPT